MANGGLAQPDTGADGAAVPEAVAREMAARDFLFIAGVPRAGSVTLTECVELSPEVAMCMRRYMALLRRTNRLTPDLYHPDRFRDLRETDTYYYELGKFKDNLRYLEKFDTARYIGDNIPQLHEYYDMILSNFERCKIVFVLRNVFDVAADFEGLAKYAAAHPEAGVWGPQRDATRGIVAWNAGLHETARRIDDPRLMVVSYEDLFLRNIGWSRLSRFLGMEFRRPRFWRPEYAPAEPDPLDETVRERILLNARIDEYRDMIRTVRADYRPDDDEGRCGTWLETWNEDRDRFHVGSRFTTYMEDRPVVEYRFQDLPNCAFMVRAAPEPPDVVCIGSAATLGRFVDRPFPQILAETLGAKVGNYGYGGARPETYLAQPGVLQRMASADLTILEFMSARGMENRFFMPRSLYDLRVLLRPEWRQHPAFAHLGAGAHFIDRIWNPALERIPEEAVAAAAESVEAYERDFVRLAEQARNVVLLWFSQRAPDEADADAMPYSFPHLLGRKSFERLSARFPAVTVVSTRGLPQPLLNRRTGEPEPLVGSATPTVNTYYPSPEMHEEAAEALRPVVARILQTAGRKATA